VPEKCLPAELFGYAAKAEPDFCGAAAPGDQAIQVGGACAAAVIGNALDPCVAGAMCYGLIGQTSTCLQLCADTQIGNSGPAGGCAAGFTCTATNFTNTPSTHTGVCEPTPDAG